MDEQTHYQEILDELRVRLRVLREGKRMTLDDASRRTGIDATAISRFETGSRVPSVPQLLSLADVLGTDVGYLLSRPPPRRRRAEEAGGEA